MGHHREFAHGAARLQGTSRSSVDAAELHRSSDDQEPAESQIGHLLLDRPDFQIRLADAGTTEESDALIYRMYTQRGYKLNKSAGALQAANEITLQACRETHVFGTLSVRFDSHRGLGADTLYGEQIDDYRHDGAYVAELTRLAVDPEFGSKEVLGALFHLAYVFCGRIRNVDDVFIEVNPRHVPFYRRMLHFTAIGECKICPRVAAPAILMHVKVAYVGAQAALWGAQHSAPTRSLYPYFCSQREEEEVTQRIVDLHGHSARKRLSAYRAVAALHTGVARRATTQTA
jgi:N-acyl amino acid synthase FeeM